MLMRFPFHRCKDWANKNMWECVLDLNSFNIFSNVLLFLWIYVCVWMRVGTVETREGNESPATGIKRECGSSGKAALRTAKSPLQLRF